MRSGGSKSKGNGFELVICKALSLWISKGERTDLFARNVTSGGAFTTAAAKGQKAGHSGDVMPSEILGHEFLEKLMIECKFWKDLQLESALWGKGILAPVLTKTEQQAYVAKKHFLLVTKQNNRPTLIFADNVIGGIFIKLASSEAHYHRLWRGRTFVCLFDDILKLDPDAFMNELARLKI